MAGFQYLISLAAAFIIAVSLTRLYAGLYNAIWHPLTRFPGPKVAAFTSWYKTWQEVFLGRSWTVVLAGLHDQYGDFVRVGPNELHFSKPAAYNDIYNNANRWDKDYQLYRSFGEDRSSFGYLTYKEAKARKDVLAPLFCKRAVSELHDLVVRNMNSFCSALSMRDKEGRSSDFLYGLRCFTADTIMAYCFAQDIDATAAPDFKAPIVVAVDAAAESFVVFRNFETLRRIVFGLPGWVTKLTAPPMAGLVDLQVLLRAQLTRALNEPESLNVSPHPTIYHRLLDPAANKFGLVPSYDSLYEEAQALLFGGADSAANTTAIGLLHILKSQQIYDRLKAEIRGVWPQLQTPPSIERLEALPYLNAVIKESLRMAPGVPAPLLRVVPPAGASIGGQQVPGGTVVGMSSIFVHDSPELFTNPTSFYPERWLKEDAAQLEQWLVAFSKGPRSCLGRNLAMCELYIAFAYLLRKFEITVDAKFAESPKWKEAFLQSFIGNHPRAFFKPVQD